MSQHAPVAGPDFTDPPVERRCIAPADVAPAEQPPVTWAERAASLHCTPYPADEGTARLATLWSGGRLASSFDADALARLARYLSYARVAAQRQVIRQDETGDFMLIVLDGAVAVERAPLPGSKARLAEARAGDVLGEMALLDAGPRFSTCTTRTPCVLGVLEMDALTRMMRDDAPLSVTLLAALARRLSLRLRQVSARLSALLTET
jgi:CRP/FNR family transcriptional regulator, cyclic AMP receptor protein